MVRICEPGHPACEPSCVNGDSNQNAHPCEKEGGKERELENAQKPALLQDF